MRSSNLPALAPFEFAIADETRQLMRDMVANGEVDALVPDRVWKETESALAGPNPRLFFEALRSCGALGVVYPEVDALFGVPQPAKWHPEIDTGVHTMMVIEQAARLSDDVEVRSAALVHDLGEFTLIEVELRPHGRDQEKGQDQESSDMSNTQKRHGRMIGSVRGEVGCCQ